MISTEPTVLEACGGFIPESSDLKTLLLHQQAKGLLGVKGTAYLNTESFNSLNTMQINLISLLHFCSNHLVLSGRLCALFTRLPFQTSRTGSPTRITEAIRGHPQRTKPTLPQ